MLSRVKKVFIGKDIARTSSAVLIPYLNGGSAAQNAAEGEIFVLDKTMNIMAAGKTITDSDVIYIAEVLGITNTYSNAAGTSISAKDVLISQPIDGRRIKKYLGKAYAAKVEQVVTVGGVTAPTLSAGKEYVLRIVYKDVKEHPGQKTQTYRIIGNAVNTANATALFNAFRTLINKDTNSRVTATGTTTLILTAKAIPECTTSLSDIDEFRQVSMEVFFYYLDPAASVTSRLAAADIAYTTAVSAGAGTWEQTRDEEKSVLGQHRGVTNRIHFPVKQPDLRTVKSATYNQIVIEHDSSIQTPDNGYLKTVRLETKIYVPTNATTNQMDSILAVLNPWMESAGKEVVTF